MSDSFQGFTECESSGLLLSSEQLAELGLVTDQGNHYLIPETNSLFLRLPANLK
jgi:hypothetical protein